MQNDFNLQAADILFFAETRYLPTDTDEDISLPGYRCFRNDSLVPTDTRPPHGLAMYHKPTIICNAHNANGKSIEITQCTVELSSMLINIIVLYKPPKTQLKHLLNALFVIFQKMMPSTTNTIVLGDFNVDISEYAQSSTKVKLLDFFQKYNLKEVIQPAVTTDYNTAIDHIYTNIKNIKTGVSETYYSYHKAIWIALG